MRYLRIFLLHFGTVFEHRARSFVWFLLSLLNPLLLLLFWKGATYSKHANMWSFSTIASYYFLLIIASSFLTAHVEEDVSRIDIQNGALSKYLVRPFSYYWMKFIEEIPYRILQGIYGVIACMIFVLIFGKFFVISQNALILLLSVPVIVAAYCLFFTFKMIIGLLSFWLTDTGGFFQLVEIIILIFAGYILPLELLPDQVAYIAKILPFGYMIYFPVIAVEGKLQVYQLLHVIGMQAVWILLFILLYQFVWHMGTKKFTALGQ